MKPRHSNWELRNLTYYYIPAGICIFIGSLIIYSELTKSMVYQSFMWYVVMLQLAWLVRGGLSALEIDHQEEQYTHMLQSMTGHVVNSRKELNAVYAIILKEDASRKPKAKKRQSTTLGKRARVAQKAVRRKKHYKV